MRTKCSDTCLKNRKTGWDNYFQKPEKEEEFENHIAVISAAFEKYASDDAGTILDGEYNIAVRTGYHCAPLIHDIIGSKNMAERYG